MEPAKDAQKLSEEVKDGEFENLYKCPICLNLLYNPVTVPCGHTYCQECFSLCMSHNPECPVCKEKLFLASPPRVNLVMKETIEKRYPELIKKMEQLHKTQEGGPAGEEAKGRAKCFCVRRDRVIIVPTERLALRADRNVLEDLLMIMQMSSRCVVVSSVPTQAPGTTEFYGCLVEPNIGRMINVDIPVIQLVGVSRFKVERVYDEFVEAVGRQLTVCEGTMLEDLTPASEGEQTELANLAAAVFEQYKTRMQDSPTVFREEIAHRFDREPYLSGLAGLAARVKFAQQVSLHMASALRAADRNPAVLCGKDTRARLIW